MSRYSNKGQKVHATVWLGKTAFFQRKDASYHLPSSRVTRLLTRYRVQLPLTILLVLAHFATASAAHGDDSPQSDADFTTIVIMAPGGPIFGRMQILIDGKSYRTWVADFLGRKLDINRDGILNLTELKLIPQRLMQQIETRTAKQILRRVSRDKQAMSISSADFNAWFSERLSRSFNIIAGAVKASEAVRLAALIDTDGDGAIGKAELRQGSRTLRFRDLDNDQTFSASELMPFRDPRNQAAAVIPDVANLPFVQLTDEASVVRTREQILKRYGDMSRLRLEKLRLPVTQTSTIDGDSSGDLDVVECQDFLESPAFHLAIDVLLSDRSNSSTLEFRVEESATAFCEAVPERRGRAKLTIDGMPINVRARGGGTNVRSFFTSMLGQRFSLYDADKSNYLSEEEFPQMQQQMAQQQIMGDFNAVDLDGDGMVMREEITGYVERDAISTQSKIEVTVKQDGKTLFSILDKDVDRRLTPREFNEGFTALLEYDANGDGKLMEQELGTAYILEIGLAQAEVLRTGMMGRMNMRMQSADAVLPGLSGLTGPEWFRRMDRNQDRDVSYREFLGPPDIFKQLDVDVDGLLSATEAEALTK